MYKMYKFRLYPDSNQKILISKTFGCYRFIYNYFLDICNKNRYIKAFDMCSKLKELYSEYEWLKEVDSCSLRCAIFNLEDAYKNYFSKRTNYPMYKSKYKRQTYRTNCIRSTYNGRKYSSIEIDLKERKIKLPKLGLVEIRGYRKLDKINEKIINATVIKETTNKYYVSVLVELEEEIKEKVKARTIVGIDLGVKDLVVTSNGEKYANPKELMKYENRIKKLQRKLSRQVKRSKNYNKTRVKISKLYSKVKNARKNNIIKIVNEIIEKNDIIVSEKLNVVNMSHKNNIAKNILDASFGKICEMLKRKSIQRGKYYYQIDRYYPSSQICSHCNSRKEEVKDLSIRTWKCDKCGNINDRDINASINIMLEGLKMMYN